MASAGTLAVRDISEFYFRERTAVNPATGVPLGVTGPNREWRRRYLGSNYNRLVTSRHRDLVTKVYLARAMHIRSMILGG